ncbi:MAG: hypothetical protein LBP67_05895 [Bacteroidales bacterium]|jgi:p-aminobenzoyl-glutamate transporter AbgT|nr:hypothetical protein [Bacteroidales bacterium]
MDWLYNFLIVILVIGIIYYLVSGLIIPLMIRRFVNKKNRHYNNNVEDINDEDEHDSNANRINKEKSIQDDFGDYTDYEELD